MSKSDVVCHDADVSLAIHNKSVCFAGLSESRTVTLPPLAKARYLSNMLVIKDMSGNCSSTRKIVVVGSGSDKIDNMNSVDLETEHGCVTLYPASAENWVVIARYECPDAYSS